MGPVAVPRGFRPSLTCAPLTPRCRGITPGGAFNQMWGWVPDGWPSFSGWSQDDFSQMKGLLLSTVSALWEIKRGEKIHKEETLCWVPWHQGRSEWIELQPAVLTSMDPRSQRPCFPSPTSWPFWGLMPNGRDCWGVWGKEGPGFKVFKLNIKKIK